MHILFVRFSYVHPYVRAFQKIESITFIHNAHIFLWVLLTMTRFSFSSPPKLFGGSLFFNVLNSASWCRSVVEKVLFIPEMFPDVLNEISSNFYRMEETSKRRERQKKSTKHQLHILCTVRNYGKVWLYLYTAHTVHTVHHIYILCYYSEQSLPQHNVNHFIMVVWWVPVHIGPWNGMV